MNTKINWACACGISLAGLAGCVTTTRGPQPIISSNGALTAVSEGQGGVLKQFLTDEAVASSNPSDATARAMLESGFTLIYANCNDFFVSAGTTQKWLTVSRDTVGVLGTLATSALALHNGSHIAVSNVAFGTAAAFSGLDIYTKDFLFSAENIDAVRTLVMNALNTHQRAVEAISGSVTYGTVSEALLDHQDICSPQSITALVRAAIKSGNVQSSPNPSSELSKVNDARDDKALADLGLLFALPGAASMDQAQSIWQLAKNSPAPVSYIAIYKKLTASGVNPDQLPIDSNGATTTPWTAARRSEVAQALSEFSDATKITLNTATPAPSPSPAPATAPAPGPSHAPTAAPVTPPPDQPPSKPAPRVRSLHVTVQIAQPNL